LLEAEEGRERLLLRGRGCYNSRRNGEVGAFPKMSYKIKVLGMC
jgi:hypothetical protein